MGVPHGQCYLLFCRKSGAEPDLTDLRHTWGREHHCSSRPSSLRGWGWGGWMLRGAAVPCLVAQSCLTLCDPVDCNPPGSSVHRILQSRILEWVAMPSPAEDLPTPGIKPVSPALQADSLLLSHQGSPVNDRQTQSKYTDKTQFQP